MQNIVAFICGDVSNQCKHVIVCTSSLKLKFGKIYVSIYCFQL